MLAFCLVDHKTQTRLKFDGVLVLRGRSVKKTSFTNYCIIDVKIKIYIIYVSGFFSGFSLGSVFAEKIEFS
jgi:hypothetical protein